MCSSAIVRKLLSKAEGICEANEIVLRAIFDRNALTADFKYLKENGPSRKCFLPRLNKEKTGYETGLSVIHQDGRPIDKVTPLARLINPASSLKALAGLPIGLLSTLFDETENMERLEVIRDDVTFEGHTEITPMPDQEEECLRIATQLVKLVREHHSLIPC